MASSSKSAKDEKEETNKELTETEAPDGGWGWVVVGGTCLLFNTYLVITIFTYFLSHLKASNFPGEKGRDMTQSYDKAPLLTEMSEE